MVWLYPRLDVKTAYEIWETHKELTVRELEACVVFSHSTQYYASTGGTQIAPESLREIRVSILAIASGCGYPDDASQAALSEFDHKAAAWLCEHLDMIEGEALRQEVWAFLALCVMPDIVKWRFRAYHESRLLGGRRNFLQRLWLRARAFDLGPKSKQRWGLIKVMTEDAFVSVVERPSLSGNSNISKAIGIAWCLTAKKVGKPNMEEINRNAIRRLRALSVLYLLDSLNGERLRALVVQCFEEAAKEAVG